MIFFFISLSTYLCYLIIKTKNNLKILNSSKNLKTYRKKAINQKSFINLELLFIILTIIAVNTDAKITAISTIIVYTILFLNLNKQKSKKAKLNKTTIITTVILAVIYFSIFILFALDYKATHGNFLIFDNTKYYYTILYIMCYINNILILINASIVNIFTKEHITKE